MLRPYDDTRAVITQEVLSHRLAVLTLVWVAFGFRIFFAEWLPYDYDRSYPHGIGVTIVHELTHGLPPVTLLHSESSNSGLTNPALTNYVFALVALFDRSPYIATLITAFVGAIVAALTYDLGRRLFGRTVGLIALGIVASSPWSAFFARGSWYTGYFELSAALPAWLLLKALLPQQPSTKKVGLAVISSAVLAHLYLVSFALVAQVGAVLLLAWAHLRHKAKLLAVFIAAWLVSFAFLAVVIAANRGSNIRPEGFSLVYGNPSPTEQNTTTTASLNFVTLPRFGSLISGRWEGWLDYIHTTTQAILRDGDQMALSNAWQFAYRARAFAIEAALVIGFVLWLTQARARRKVRWALAWLLVPMLGQIVVTSVLPTFPANHQNLFLASPISYLMAGCGFMAVFGGMGRLGRSANKPGFFKKPGLFARGLFALGLAALVVVPIVGWMADAEALQSPNPIPPADAMPLHWQLHLGQIVRAHCNTLASPENPFEPTRLKMQYWAAGLMQDAGRVRANADIHVGNADAAQDAAQDAWQVSAAGGDCAIRSGGQTGPPFAQPLEISGPELLGRVQVYRSLAATAATQGQLRANIGWRLLAAQHPARIRRGQTAIVSLSWLIEQLPNEPFAAWRYDTFVKLIGPNGQSVSQADTPSVAGGTWVVGEFIQTATRLAVPADAPPGDYQLSISLFDRAQSKNAAFFKGNSPEASASFELVVRVE